MRPRQDIVSLVNFVKLNAFFPTQEPSRIYLAHGLRSIDGSILKYVRFGRALRQMSYLLSYWTRHDDF